MFYSLTAVPISSVSDGPRGGSHTFRDQHRGGLRGAQPLIAGRALLAAPLLSLFCIMHCSLRRSSRKAYAP